MKNEETGGRRGMSWSFDAGHLALDFVNTLEWRGRDPSHETLHDYTDVIEWAHQGHIFTESEVDQLISKAPPKSNQLEIALQRVRQLREGLYRIFSNLAAGIPPDSSDLELLQNTIVDTMNHSSLEWKEDGLAWVWRSVDKPVDRVLWMIAQDALDLLSDDLIDRIGECADDRGCAYLFIDMTRNHSRKWCSMDSCGNRAKAKKHYERKKRVEAGSYP
jgi:predicted RNA-binding Zn ribbon-like protein